MWGLAFLYLKNTSSTYTSKFSLSLPGTITHTDVSLPDRGTAYSQPVSPYENTTQDPRENYKFVIENPVVQKAAAAKLHMLPEEFGKPRFKIVDKTTVMNFELIGNSPKEAEAKSWAFYKAFQERLDVLRRQEAERRETKLRWSLRESQKKLDLAQKRFFNYRNRSGLVSDTQIEELATNLEKLRIQKNEAVIKQQQNSTRMRELSANFKVSTSEATNSLILQSDPLFRDHLKNYSEASANLVLLESKFLPTHPSIVDTRSKQQLAKSALIARSESILGYSIDQQTLNKLSGDGTKQTFLESVVTAGVNKQEFQTTVQELDRQTTQLEARLQIMAKHKSMLEALKREMQISEAVYSSTLASLDVNKSNFYGSYPEIQLLTDPTLPKEPGSPNTKLVLLGTGLASLFSISWLLIIYWRSNSIKFRPNINEHR